MRETNQTHVPSATWLKERGSLRRGGAPESQSAASLPSVWRLPMRDDRKRLGAVIWREGGPLDYWVVETRGIRFRVPGHVCIGDVGRWVNSAGGYLDH